MWLQYLHTSECSWSNAGNMQVTGPSNRRPSVMWSTSIRTTVLITTLHQTELSSLLLKPSSPHPPLLKTTWKWKKFFLSLSTPILSSGNDYFILRIRFTCLYIPHTSVNLSIRFKDLGRDTYTEWAIQGAKFHIINTTAWIFQVNISAQYIYLVFTYKGRTTFQPM